MNMNYFKIEKNNKEIWLKDWNNKHKKKKMIFLEFIKYYKNKLGNFRLKTEIRFM